MTDCLLQAYDCVARRAYEIFLARGGESGGELDDWLTAERELLGSLTVDLAEGEDYVSALASLPGLSGAEIEIGIDPRWIVILGRRSDAMDPLEDYPDPHRVAEFSRTVHASTQEMRAASPIPDTLIPNEAADFAAEPRAQTEPGFTVPGCERSSKDPATAGSPSNVFCVRELPAEVDPERSVAVFANGILGVHMPKISVPLGPPC